MNSNLTPQTPAVGISAHDSYTNDKWFTIECRCHDSEHSAQMIVEADEDVADVNVTFYVDVKTAWWKDHCYRHFDWLPYSAKYWINRIINSVLLCYHGIFHGYIKYSADMILSRQSALNLSDALVKAIDEVNTTIVTHQKGNSDEA